MKEKLLKNGESAFAEHEILEMLLYYSLPRQDTNELAHTLLSEFGSITNVLNAPDNKLMKIKGIKRHSVALFRLVKIINDFEKKTTPSKSVVLNSFSSANKYLSEYFSSKTNEYFCALLLNSSMKLIEFVEFTTSECNHVNVAPAEIVKLALDVKASNVIVAHNHLSDRITPSYSDMDFTTKLKTALSVFDINLIEHFIVNKSGAHPTMRINLARMSSSFSGNTLSADFLSNFYNS